MERLTCNKLNKLTAGCYFVNFASKEEATKYRMLAESAPKYEEIYKRLAEYENAEEQGLLLRLPCKVGSTIYLVDFEENDYDEATIEYFEIDKDGITINSDYEYGTKLDAEYVFLTKEEAEQALEKDGE